MDTAISSDSPRIWRYLPFETYSGAINMAVDEYFMHRIADGNSPNILRFYQWKPSTATIGRHQSLSAEIDLKFAHEHGIDVVRRISGGGAVLHAEHDEITYSVICKLSDLPALPQSSRIYDDSIPGRYQCILESLATGLESIGIRVDTGKIHCPALFMEGKKFSGNAQAISRGILLQHGTILLRVNPEFMYHVLKAPEGVSYTKMIQSVRTKVTGLLTENKDEGTVDVNRIIGSLKNGFERILKISIQEQAISIAEMEKIRELATKRYATRSWLEKFP
jgi:lipoate-protein ligase A